jgi:hypothetical protein
MEQLYSIAEPKTILGIIFSRADMLRQEGAGVDLTAETEFLQARSLRAPLGKSYKAHKHPPQFRETSLTQESLVVIEGSIEANIYDLDDRPLFKRNLSSGDCIVLLRGGHAFTIMKDNTIFYEFKNGPYNGPEKCKTMITEANA